MAEQGTLSTVEILRKSRASIDRPEKHIKGPIAANAGGRPTDVNEPDACRFCAFGALRLVMGYRANIVCSAAWNALNDHVPKPFVCIVDYSDDPGVSHADLMRVWDAAIAAEEAPP